jgi:hypothetical protein
MMMVNYEDVVVVVVVVLDDMIMLAMVRLLMNIVDYLNLK